MQMTPFLSFFSKISRGLLGLVAVSVPAVAEEEHRVLHVREFGAIPDDGLDDMPAINEAIRTATRLGASEVRFDSGTYRLQETVTVGGFGHDNYMIVDHAKNMALVGEVDEDGKPTTRIVRDYELNNEAKPPIQLRIWNSDSVSIRNFVFTNDPPMGSTAKVVSVDRENDVVVVEVLPGLPAYDGMRAASAHAWRGEVGGQSTYS